MSVSNCRSCGTSLEQLFCDLGLSPISNAFINKDEQDKGEMFYPLRTHVCHQCWLVQLDESLKSEEHFHDNYVYFSSYSESWLAHAQKYVKEMVQRFALSEESKVMEIASNDGYLLQYFVKDNIPCLGVEPTSNTAAAARKKGVQTRESFFGFEVAGELKEEGWQVDLLLGNNVLAHVPDINHFVSGMPVVLKPEGVVTLEFPHLLNLIDEYQFDTIYHEHYSYLSLSTLIPLFVRNGLRVFDVETLNTHGGSLRLFLCHQQSTRITSERVQMILDSEEKAGLLDLSIYKQFAEHVQEVKRNLLDFVIGVKREGKSIAAYGAAAKGNTLLNYCGINADFIDFVADLNPTKQEKLLPGTRIPVVDPKVIFESKPDYLLILPWNIKDEIMKQMSGIREWEGQFVIPIPDVSIVS